jgi:hypothetical protein
MQERFNEVFNALQVGAIIMINFTYYRVLSFSKSEKTMFGANLIDMNLEEVKFNHYKWEWSAVSDAEETSVTPFNVTVTKPVDYVLIGDTLRDENGNHVETYLGIEDDDFEDIEQKTRFMLEDDSLYADFRNNYHILDSINTVDAHTAVIAEIKRLQSLDAERLRKLSLLD